MSKVIIAIVALIIIGGLGFVLTIDNNSENDSSEQGSNSQPETASNEPENKSPQKELDPNNYTANANIGAAVVSVDGSDVKITIDDNIFNTTYLKIKKGTKVTWTNEGNLRHDVTSADSSPKQGLGSPLLGKGETYEFTFNETGVYEYFCTPHSSEMRGVITVVEQ